MSSQIGSFLGLLLMIFGALGGAFVMGTRYEAKKQGAKYLEEVRKMLNLTKGIRADIDSDKLPSEYRD